MLSDIIILFQKIYWNTLRKSSFYDPDVYSARAFLSQQKPAVSINLAGVDFDGKRIYRGQSKVSFRRIKLANQLINSGKPYILDDKSIIAFLNQDQKTKFEKTLRVEWQSYNPEDERLRKMWSNHGQLFGYPDFAIKDFLTKEFHKPMPDKFYVLIKPLGLFFGILESSIPNLEKFLKAKEISSRNCFLYIPVWINNKQVFTKIKNLERYVTRLKK